MSNSVLDAVLLELEKVGVKPTLTRGSKHILISWEIGGQTGLQTVPSTPSDWRGALNARAQARRTLRQMGAFGQTSISLEKALQPPIIRTETPNERAVRLESDVDALLDWLAELTDKFDTLIRGLDRVPEIVPRAYVVKAGTIPDHILSVLDTKLGRTTHQIFVEVSKTRPTTPSAIQVAISRLRARGFITKTPSGWIKLGETR